MSNEWKKAGVVGVDAGILWIGDPCYILNRKQTGSAPIEPMQDYDAFLRALQSKEKEQVEGVTQFDYHMNPNNPGLGVVVGGFGGDGEYQVFTKTNSSGLVSAVKVVLNRKDD